MDEKIFPIKRRSKWNDGLKDAPYHQDILKNLVRSYDMELILEELCQICENIAYDDCSEGRFCQWNLRKMAIDKLFRNFPKLDD
jgi:hypothetical protein